jgi:hypothetical protein
MFGLQFLYVETSWCWRIKEAPVLEMKKQQWWMAIP